MPPQPIGLPATSPSFSPPTLASLGPFFQLSGFGVVARRLHPQAHLDALWAAFEGLDASFYTYLFSEPFKTREELAAQLAKWDADSSVILFTIFAAAAGEEEDEEGRYSCDVDEDAFVRTHKCLGMGSLMRADTTHRSVEVGTLCFPPMLLAGTRYSTAFIYLLLRFAFSASAAAASSQFSSHPPTLGGYHRVEWKCDALNAPSRRAAARYGFTFEGLFRQCVIYKGRRRDTCWFAMLADEWEAWIRPAFEAYLSLGNFTEESSGGGDGAVAVAEVAEDGALQQEGLAKREPLFRHLKQKQPLAAFMSDMPSVLERQWELCASALSLGDTSSCAPADLQKAFVVLE